MSCGWSRKEHPEARTIRGREQVQAYRRSWEQAMPGLQIVLERILDAGQRVLALGTVTGTGSGSGAAISVPLSLLFTIRDGRVVRAEEYLDPHEGMRAAGLDAQPAGAPGRSRIAHGRDTARRVTAQPVPDLVTLTRRSMEATNRREFDVAATMFAPDAVFDVSAVGMGRFEGVDAVHGYLADWLDAYETQELREWEGRELGNGVVFVVALFEARPRGSLSTVRERWGFTVVWEHNAIKQVLASRDIEAARAAAQARV